MPPIEPTRIDPAPEVPITAWHFDGNGDGDGPMAIGLADLTASGLWFGDLAETLGGRARLVAPDLRGRAASVAAPRTASFDDHITDVLSLADRCGVATFSLVGHGTGAAVALAVAAAAPTRIHRLVLLDGPPVPPGDSHPDRLAGSAVVDPGVLRLGATWAHRDAAVAADLASGRLPATGLTRSLRRAVASETTGSGFGWRARLDADTIGRDWAFLRTWQPPRPGETITVAAFGAAHGHRVDEPPIDCWDLGLDVQVIATTHTGLVSDRVALHAVAEALDAPA